KYAPLAFAIGRGVDGFPGATRRRSRGEGFVIRNRYVVGTDSALWSDFLEDAATVAGVGAWFHAAFCHFRFSLNRQVIRLESPRATKEIVKSKELTYLPRSVPYTGSRPRRRDGNLQKPPSVAALGGFFPS